MTTRNLRPSRRRYSCTLVVFSFMALTGLGSGPADADEQPGANQPTATSLPAQIVPARKLFQIVDPAVTEASGVAVAPDGITYTFNDAGNAAELYGIDGTGAVRTVVNVPKPNEDWEDMAISQINGTWTITIADTGDNYLDRNNAGLGPRTKYAIIRADLPPTPTSSNLLHQTATGVKSYSLVWPDRASHNGETLLVMPGTGRVYIVDKAYDATTTPYLWEAPALLSSTGENMLSKVGPIDIEAASGGAISSDGTRMVIRNTGAAFIWTLTPGAPLSQALTKPPVQILLPRQRQGEGVGFTTDGAHLLLTSEGPRQSVWQVDLPNLLRAGGPPTASATPVPGVANVAAKQPSRLPMFSTLGGGVMVVMGLAYYLEWRRRQRRH